MNTTKYLQTDSRWSGLGYPKYPCTIGNSGCGEVAVCNAIIEMKQYQNYNPKTIQPYCKQYAAPSCDGTYFSGIPKMMKHYGLTEVKEHATMDSLWKELAKGDRVAIYLVGNRPGGSKRVHWTSSAHFVCSVDYRFRNGEHEVYMKDSNSDSSLRNGWIGYSTHLKGDVSMVWSGKLNGAKPSPTPTPTPTPSGKLVVDGVGGTATVKRMQEFFKTTQDGVIGGQNRNYAVLYPSLTAVSFGKGGSRCIVELQKWLGLSDPDGVIGKNTTRAWQRKLVALGYFPKNEAIDGIFGVRSMKAWQECLNNNGKKKGGKPTPTPTPDPKPTPSKSTKVIDVSEFQDSINWSKVKADGVDGAIIRCGFRGATTAKLQMDAMFLNHIRGASKAGVKVGIYMFTEAINEKEGREEADYAVKLWQTAGVPIYYPIAVDTEQVNIKGERARNLTKAQRTNAIKGFCQRIKELGYTPMIYASTDWLNKKLDMSKLPYDVWVAQYYKECQYKGKYVMWQYTSDGRVAGVKGNVDLNKCYITPKIVNPPKDEPKKKEYSGKYPEVRVKRSNAEVLANTIKFAKWIAGDNDFHYGHGKEAHHNGCYFCGTQPSSKKKAGIKMWEHTYCCNPFVHACWAHGGLIPEALKRCQEGRSWDFNKGSGYDASKLFDKLGHPPIDKLKAGDVLCSDTHVLLYLGGKKYVDAGLQDDNVIHSDRWNRSIGIRNLTNSNYHERVYRFNSSVDADIIIRHGEVSERVADLQAYLDWYFDGKVGKPYDGIYGDNTLKWCKEFQEREIGKGEGDGTVGPKTIAAMKKVRK